MEIGVRQPPCAGPMGFGAFCEWAAEQGFAAIDVPALTPEVKQVLDANGLAVGTVDLVARDALVSLDADRRKAGLEEMKRAMGEAGERGAKVFFTVLLPQDHAQPRAKSFEGWQAAAPAFAELCEANGFHLAIEAWVGPGPHYPCLGCTPETLRPMFAEVPSPNLGLCYDPSHLVRLGIDHIRFLWEFGGRIKHVHGKDTELLEEGSYLTGYIGPTFKGRYAYGETAWRYCIPGEGEIDWTAVRNRLLDVGYDGLICVELEDGNYFPEVEDQQLGLINALEHLEAILR